MGGRQGYDRRPLLIAAGVVLAIGVAATIDFRVTVGQVPDVPPLCEPSTVVCEDARGEAFSERLLRSIELGDAYELRAWLYALAAFVVVLIATRVALGRTEADRRREIFTDLGVGAVCWLLTGLPVLAGISGGLLTPPSAPIFLPGLALMAIALVGTVLTRRPPASEQGTGVTARSVKKLRALGFGLTAVAVLLAVAVLASRGDPCVSGVSDSAQALAAAALAVAALAALTGLIALFQRAWVSAAALLAIGPFAAMLAALGNACWN